MQNNLAFLPSSLHRTLKLAGRALPDRGFFALEDKSRLAAMVLGGPRMLATCILVLSVQACTALPHPVDIARLASIKHTPVGVGLLKRGAGRDPYAAGPSGTKHNFDLNLPPSTGSSNAGSPHTHVPSSNTGSHNVQTGGAGLSNQGDLSVNHIRRKPEVSQSSSLPHSSYSQPCSPGRSSGLSPLSGSTSWGSLGLSSSLERSSSSGTSGSSSSLRATATSSRRKPPASSPAAHDSDLPPHVHTGRDQGVHSGYQLQADPRQSSFGPTHHRSASGPDAHNGGSTSSTRPARSGRNADNEASSQIRGRRPSLYSPWSSAGKKAGSSSRRSGDGGP